MDPVVFVRGCFLKDQGGDLTDKPRCITVRKIVFSSHNSFQTYLLSLRKEQTWQGLSYKVSEIMSSRMPVMTGRDEE